MDTLTADETSVSARSVVTVVVAASLSALLVAPGLLVPAYGRAVATVLLAGCLLATGRLLLAVVVAAPPRHPPPWSSSASNAGDDADSSTLPTVSVVVTAYNEADVLPATVDACKRVDYPDDALEIVLGYEAASTDGTAAVAEAAAARDERVTAIERPAPPGGKASATNHALAAATGDVVAVLDADQRLEHDAVRRAVRWFADDDVWCVKGRCLGTNASESLVALLATVERNLVERTEFVARDRLDAFAIFTGGQAFFRRAALDAVGEFDEAVLLEDLDMAYRIQRAGGTIRVDPGVVTRETNPSTFSAWWSQRKRWARGGMQVARRYLGANLRTGPPALRARVDFAATLGSLLALPVLVLATPVIAVTDWTGYLPVHVAGGLWTIVLLAPLLASAATVALDARDGHHRDPREYVAPLLFWPYVAVQVWAIVASFLDEFVLDRPTRYVTSTTATEQDSA